MEESVQNKIERFLNREMTPDEIQSFDQELQTNEDLAKDLAFEISARKAMKRKYQSMDSPVKTLNQNRRFLQIGLAAMIVILLGTLFWIFQKNKITDDQIAMNKIIEKAKPELVTAGNDVNQLLINHNYEAAITAMESQLAKRKSEGRDPCKYQDDNFYLGVLHLYITQQYTSAVEYLTCVETNKQDEKSFYYQDIPFYLVLAMLRNNQIDEAKELIKKYKIPVEQFSDASKKLLE